MKTPAPDILPLMIRNLVALKLPYSHCRWLGSGPILFPGIFDLERKVASPRLLDKSAFRFSLPVRPMLGCIGVATAGDEVLNCVQIGAV